MSKEVSEPYGILQNSILSKPRMMGTPGEEETTNFLLSYLQERDLKPYTEEITWRTASANGRKFMFLVLALFVSLINFTLQISAPLNGILSIILIPITIILMIFFGKALIKDKLGFFGKQALGKNVICDMEPDQNQIMNKKKQTQKELEEQENQENTKKPVLVYLTAHYDSVASNLPKFYIKLFIGMAISFLIFAVLTITSSILALIHHFKPSNGVMRSYEIINIIIMVLSIYIILIVIINLFGKRVNTSPGACDNGSGSAILLSLAKFFGDHLPTQIALKFIWCTAEEWGLYGSKEYVKAHKEEIIAQKDQSYVINVDMVGSEFAYLNKSGFIRKKPLNKSLNDLIRQTAEENNIITRKFNSPISANSDHAPFKKEGVEVCMFLAKKDTKIIHSAKDTVDRVKPENLDDAVQLIKKMVEKIDFQNGIPNHS